MKLIKNPLFLLWAPVALALLVRAGLWSLLRDSALYMPLAGSGHDRTIYLTAMAAAANGSFFPPGAFEFLPLYPWLAGLAGMLFGATVTTASLLGMLCDATTTLLVALLARRLGAGAGWAALAAVFYALYPLAAIYSLLTMPNTLNALGLTAFVYAASYPDRLTWKRALLLGLGAGIVSLGFAAMLAIGAVTMVTLAFRERCLLKPLVFAAGMILPLLPLALHNSRAEGQFVLLTTHGGLNFYMGNHENATGYPLRIRDFRMTAKDMLQDAHYYAEFRNGRSMTRSESSAWWRGEAHRYWREQPAQAAWITLKKVMLFWHHREVDDLRMLEQLRIDRPVLRYITGIPFAIFSLLGMVGLLYARGAAVPKATLLTGMASLAIFFITARYRLALVPLMAALGMAGLHESFKSRRQIPLLALGIMIVIILFPFGFRDQRPVDYYNMAIQLMGTDRIEEARQVVAEGLEVAPDYSALHGVMGSIYFQREQFAEAAASFQRSLELFPNQPRVCFNLALAYARLGRFCDARDLLVEASRAGLALEPHALGLLREVAAACQQQQTPGPTRSN